MTFSLAPLFHFGLPLVLAVVGFGGLFHFKRVDYKAGAWFLLQASAGLLLIQFAIENPAPGSTGANPMALCLGVVVFLVALLIGFLLFGMAFLLKSQNGTWDEDEINRRLKP